MSRSMRFLSVFSFLLTGWLILAEPAKAMTRYTFENVIIPGFEGVVIHPSQGNYFGITGINDSGAMSGSYFRNSGPYHGFLLRNGALRTIDFPGATTTGVHGITTSHLFWGTAYPPSGNFLQFLGNRQGDLEPVSFPMQYGQIGGVNDSGLIAATTYSQENGFVGVPILIRNGSVDWLDIPDLPTGTGNFWLTGLNNRGVVIGHAYDENTLPLAFLFHRGTTIALAPPDRSEEDYFTLATGINDHNQVVGTYTHPELGGLGFLFDRGTYTKIKYPDPTPPPGFPTDGEWIVLTDTQPSDINNRGQIVGQWQALFLNFTHGVTATLYGSFQATPSSRH